jgi:hypothetical protein
MSHVESHVESYVEELRVALRSGRNGNLPDRRT